MQFHAAILNFDAAVAAKRRHDSLVLGRDAFGRKMLDKIKRLLREKLGDDPVCRGTFLASSRRAGVSSSGSNSIPFGHGQVLCGPPVAGGLLLPAWLCARDGRDARLVDATTINACCGGCAGDEDLAKSAV